MKSEATHTTRKMPMVAARPMPSTTERKLAATMALNSQLVAEAAAMPRSRMAEGNSSDMST